LLQIPDHAAYDCLGRLVLGASISPDDWQRFIDNSDVLRISKGTRVIEAGEHIDQVYFCVHGLFRLFYILEDGSEYNVTFSLENDFITCGAL
jgi:CRP-like cAMP-binding protein